MVLTRVIRRYDACYLLALVLVLESVVSDSSLDCDIPNTVCGSRVLIMCPNIVTLHLRGGCYDSLFDILLLLDSRFLG
jgi:hypothetical protein